MSQPDNKIHLSVPRDEARKRLTEQIKSAAQIIGDGIKTQTALSEVVEREKRWYQYIKQLLATLFSTRKYADEYSMAAAERPLNLVADCYLSASGAPSTIELSNRLRSRINVQISCLRSILERLDLVQDTPVRVVDAEMQGEQKLELLIDRFHRVAQQIRKRRQSRPALIMKDEYDVQYLLHGLLQIFFDDVRDEEWTSSYAGKASRMDFLLPGLKTVVEAKKTRPSLTAGVLGNELLVDIARYQKHPQCRQLFCFVYDPDGHINNPRGVEADLSKQHSDLSVRVMIMPRS
jgi:hypothetical protein